MFLAGVKNGCEETRRFLHSLLYREYIWNLSKNKMSMYSPEKALFMPNA